MSYFKSDGPVLTRRSYANAIQAIKDAYEVRLREDRELYQIEQQLLGLFMFFEWARS
jgi:hypothetical protein